jgi:hypothetical protein
LFTILLLIRGGLRTDSHTERVARLTPPILILAQTTKCGGGVPDAHRKSRSCGVVWIPPVPVCGCRAFLRAVNSGHPGSITTVHADSPDGALDQIALLAMTSGFDLGWSKIQTYVHGVIDTVVHLERRNGARRVTKVQLLCQARRSACTPAEAAA